MTMLDVPTLALLDRTQVQEQDQDDLRLLVELPSAWRVFFGNLRDLIPPRRHPPLHLTSAPTLFWSDVFVKRGLPWRRFAESGIYHTVVFAAWVAASHFVSLRPQPVPASHFEHAQVIYYEPQEYLPPLDTRQPSSAPAEKADPEFSPQPIISVPPEADNRSQTIVTPPKVRLNHDVRLPNIVAWSDQPKMPIAPPLTPAASLTRLSPQMDNSVVSPPPDAAQADRRRDLSVMSASVMAPPRDISASRAAFQAPQPAVLAPPPTLENTSARPLGDLNIGPGAVAPAPQLPVSVQRAPVGASSGLPGTGPGVLPPPASVGTAGSSGGGRLVALNLHPGVGAPPDPPPGNRLGRFAATPEGHAGASGAPGLNNGGLTGGSKGGSGSNGGGHGSKSGSGLPSGLYVGSVAPSAKTSPVAASAAANADPPPAATPNATLGGSPVPARSAPTRALQPESEAKLLEAERPIFAGRRFYSLTVNMPNLNSAGGSWVIRFAEINRESPSESTALSAPVAIRKVDPAYPTQLMRENVSGTVIVTAIIRADGTVSNVRILRSVDERIDQFAVRAIKQWQFQPAMKNGIPVDVEATFHIPFRPSQRAAF